MSALFDRGKFFSRLGPFICKKIIAPEYEEKDGKSRTIKGGIITRSAALEAEALTPTKIRLDCRAMRCDALS